MIIQFAAAELQRYLAQATGQAADVLYRDAVFSTNVGNQERAGHFPCSFLADDWPHSVLLNKVQQLG